MARETTKFFDISPTTKDYRIKGSVIDLSGNGTIPDIAPALQSVGVTPGLIQFFFKNPLILMGDAANSIKWKITTTSYPVAITDITVNNGTLAISTTEMRTGGIYTVNFPFGVVDSLTGSLLQLTTYDVVGVGSPPNVSKIVVIDSRTLDIYFDSDVNVGDATTVNNYVITPALSIQSIVQVGSNQYRILTAKQTSGVSYTIEVNNIKDLAGNTILDTTP